MPRKGTHAQQRWPLSVMALCAATGLLFVTAAVSASGDDLRPSGGDLNSLLSERSDRTDQRRATADELQRSIDGLSGSVGGAAIDRLKSESADLEPVTGMTPARGPGVRVILDDSPAGAAKPGLDPNIFIVHEQDLQAYVNALWAGGAEAISMQGQRLISTTGIKCVGNTVLLNGRQYSPPYRIVAVGDVGGMLTSVNTSPATVTFADYAREYQLGLQVDSGSDVSVPAYDGQVNLQFATSTAAGS